MKERLIESFNHLLGTVVSSAPKVAVGILLVILAFVVAKLIEVSLRFVLTRLRFDRLLEKTGIDRALYRIGLRQELNTFVPRLVYFLVLLLLAKTASDALGLLAISNAIGAFFAYLPNIIAALLLLVLGSSLGQFAGNMAAQSAQSSGIDFAPSIGKLVSSLILFVVAMMAIAQLKIDTGMVRIVTSFILGGAALAFGISFGLGTRDIIRNIAAGFYLRKFLEVGKRLEISGQNGLLTGINATHTILESEGQSISVSNSTFLTEVARQ